MRLLNITPLDDSISNVFLEFGWEVDLDTSEHLPAGIIPHDFPRDYYQCIWAYPRGFMPKDSARNKVYKDTELDWILSLIDQCQCPIFIENPSSSALRKNPRLEGLPCQEVHYMAQGYAYSKRTLIWTNSDWKPEAYCSVRNMACYMHNSIREDKCTLPLSNEPVPLLSAPPLCLIKEIMLYCSRTKGRLLELFSGTGSVGTIFKELGWEVISLDADPDRDATITADIREWDYTVFPENYFDCIWASPVCTHYSRARTKAKTPRNLEWADSLVQATLKIFAYFKVPYFLENPQTGLLKTRPFMQEYPYQDVTYCSYGYPYQKRTRIWTNSLWTPSRPLCNRKNCQAMMNGRHLQTAQQGPGKIAGVRLADDYNNLDQLFSVPPDLVREIALYLGSILAQAADSRHGASYLQGLGDSAGVHVGEASAQEEQHVDPPHEVG